MATSAEAGPVGRRFDHRVDRRVVLADLPGRPCPIAASLELVGERWALLVVREIVLGSHRFSEIVRGTGAPRDRVAARLRALEGAGVLTRRAYQEHPTRFEYHLTQAGHDLVPVLRALITWGDRHAVATADPDRGRYAHRVLDRATERQEQP